jgi:hypothetical protein
MKNEYFSLLLWAEKVENIPPHTLSKTSLSYIVLLKTLNNSMYTIYM